MTSDAFREWEHLQTKVGEKSCRELVNDVLFGAYRAGIQEALRELDRAHGTLTAQPDSERQRTARKALCGAALRLSEAGRIIPAGWMLEFSPSDWKDRGRFGGPGEW